MLHIGAGVETLSYTDIGVNALCYTQGQGITLSNNDIGVKALCYTQGQGYDLIL